MFLTSTFCLSSLMLVCCCCFFLSLCCVIYSVVSPLTDRKGPDKVSGTPLSCLSSSVRRSFPDPCVKFSIWHCRQFTCRLKLTVWCLDPARQAQPAKVLRLKLSFFFSFFFFFRRLHSCLCKPCCYSSQRTF